MTDIDDETLDELGTKVVACVNGYMPDVALVALACVMVDVARFSADDLSSALEDIDRISAGMRSHMIEKFEERETLQ